MFSSYLFWTSGLLDVPAGVTQEEGHTEFLIHLTSAVRALIFLARRIQPFLPSSTVKSNFVYQRFNRSPHGHFIFLFFSEENPSYRGSNSRPNVSEGFEVTN